MPTQDRVRLRRLVIAHGDLVDAKSALEAWLDESLEVKPDHHQRAVRSALEHTVVIAYARCFWQNRSADSDKPAVERVLPKEAIAEFTPEEKLLHARVKEWRDTSFAHSDPASSEVDLQRLPGGLAMPVSRDPRRVLDQSSMESLQRMISKVWNWTVIELTRIYQEDRDDWLRNLEVINKEPDDVS